MASSKVKYEAPNVVIKVRILSLGAVIMVVMTILVMAMITCPALMLPASLLFSVMKVRLFCFLPFS